MALWDDVSRSDKATDYQTYLQTYPNGVYVAQAQAWLQRDAETQAAAAKNREEQAWKQAQAGNDAKSYGAYLHDYPKGRYVAVAKFRLSKLGPVTGQTFRDCDTCPEMLSLPEGSYSRSTGANVHVPPFALGKTDVTQAQWQAVMGSNPSNFQNCGADCPVEQVSWNDAQDFIRRLNERTGQHYRLPSETEWEYACGAGEPHEYCGSDNIDAVAWYDGNSGKTTHPVAKKQANAWGLYDMSGNVWQWLDDCWHDDKSLSGAPTDGSAWTSGGECAQRVLRGGSFGNDPQIVRAAFRIRYDTGVRDLIDGFRLARTLP